MCLWPKGLKRRTFGILKLMVSNFLGAAGGRWVLQNLIP